MSRIQPTAAELDILNVIWESGPSSVRQVHKQLSEKRDVFYTTTLKTMQVMHNKGLLDRDTSSRAHIYTSAVERRSVQRNLLGEMRDALFSGSTASLVISALGSGKPSEEELKTIREMIDNLSEDE